MCVLNLALQHIALSRAALPSEAQLKGASTMSEVRAAIKQDPQLQEEWAAAMQPVIEILSSRFSRLEYSGERVQVHAAAGTATIGRLLEVLQQADPTLTTLQMDKKQLSKHPVIQQALQAHMAHPRSDYLLQLIKVPGCQCALCANGVLGPPQQPEQLPWLQPCPLPTPAPAGVVV